MTDKVAKRKDRSPLPPCREDVFKNGEHVLTIAGIPAVDIEWWVKGVDLLAGIGQDVDWHFVGGRAIVKATGDIEQVRLAIWAMRDELPKAAVLNG